MSATTKKAEKSVVDTNTKPVATDKKNPIQQAAKKPRVSPEDFVRIWKNSENRNEVASALGMKLGAVVARERTYRKLGVDLKKLTSTANRGKRLDIEMLNKLCHN
jgi:hypothetical protein